MRTSILMTGLVIMAISILACASPAPFDGYVQSAEPVRAQFQPSIVFLSGVLPPATVSAEVKLGDGQEFRQLAALPDGAWRLPLAPGEFTHGTKFDGAEIRYKTVNSKGFQEYFQRSISINPNDSAPLSLPPRAGS